MNNKFGLESIIRIETDKKEGKTILKECFFTAPFKVAKPFTKDDGSSLLVYIMNASAGIMEGDIYNIQILVGKDSKLEITNQSYNKIHKMKNGYATQKNFMEVEKDATLYFLPEPTIPFENSNMNAETVVHLKKGASLVLWDIVACGRAKSNERFKFKRFKSRTEIYAEENLIYLDNLNLDPVIQELDDIGFYEGYSHYGNMILVGETFNKRYHEDFDNTLYSDIEIGITKIESGGIVVRCLGNGADRIKHVFKEIIMLIDNNAD